MDSMDATTAATDDGSERPVDEPTAPRLVRTSVTKVPASRPGRRAFVDVSPARGRSDDRARDEGRVREDRGRGFRLRHREYAARASTASTTTSARRPGGLAHRTHGVGPAP